MMWVGEDAHDMVVGEPVGTGAGRVTVCGGVHHGRGWVGAADVVGSGGGLRCGLSQTCVLVDTRFKGSDG